MNTNNFLMMGGASYEAPTLSLFEIENEGILCASTQKYEYYDAGTQNLESGDFELFE